MNQRSRLPLGRLAAEFAVIVIGVLVALFMESAWEDRQEAALAEQYLDRMQEELAGNRTALESDELFTEQNCRAAQLAYDGLSGAVPMEADQLLRRARRSAPSISPRRPEAKISSSLP